MRYAIGLFVALTACTTNGVASDPLGHVIGNGSDGPVDLYTLTVDHAVAAEGAIDGVDADQQGNLWIAYSTDGDYQQNEKPVVTVVHWNPMTRERLATFTYDDLWSPVRGLALVDGQIWLNYEEVSDSDQVIRVIDPATGAIAATFGNTGIELSGMGSGGRALVSHAFNEVDVVDTSSGGTVQAIATSFMYGGTEQGVAWRPGEIWVGGWISPMEIYNEAGTLLGTIDLPDLQSESADPVRHLAFDGSLLLVGNGGELTWYSIRP